DVDGPLHRKGSFRAACSAVRRVRHFVGGGDTGVDRYRVDFVGAGQMDCGVVGYPSADWIPCSAVHNETVTQRKNATFVVEANIHIVDLVARLTGAQQMFTAVLDPLDWPSELARQKRDQQIFRIDMPLDAKAAADVKR